MDGITITVISIGVLILLAALIILAVVFLAAFIGEPLSNSREDFEESDALIESIRKINKNAKND